MMKTLKLLPGVLVGPANTAPARFAQLPGATFRSSPLPSAAATAALFSSASNYSRNAHPECESRNASPAIIYAVDNEEGLTDLYTLLLKRNGYRVRAFNDRAEALKTLIEDKMRPDLLISDYLGGSMPVERFIQSCRIAHSGLRILMASGFCKIDVRSSCAKPDRFIQKPFTPEEFLREVSAALKA